MNKELKRLMKNKGKIKEIKNKMNKDYLKKLKNKKKKKEIKENISR